MGVPVDVQLLGAVSGSLLSCVMLGRDFNSLSPGFWFCSRGLAQLTGQPVIKSVNDFRFRSGAYILT